MIPWWLKILGPVALLAALVIGAKLYVDHIDRTARIEQKALDDAAVRTAQAQATVNHTAAARAKEAAYAKGTKDANDALLPQIDDARTRLAAYIERVRTTRTNPGGARSPDMPSTADAARIAYLTDTDTLVSVADLDICTVNTQRLKNAQAWVATWEK